MNPETGSWQVEAAHSDDVEQIRDLVDSVGGDLDRLQPEQFRVARNSEHRVIGCVRLKPYPGFYELASLAISNQWRASGVGRELVNTLLKSHQGPVFLICEDQVIEFFRRFGFGLIPPSEIPPGLESKIARYRSESGHINVMRRD
jgi:N-acetylglutamate synthase-like GNAT family acetyltransferase